MPYNDPHFPDFLAGPPRPPVPPEVGPWYDHAAPDCDDQLAVFSKVGRGLQGDGYKVEIKYDDNDETYLEGSKYDSASGTWSSEWVTENINGGQLSYRINRYASVTPPRFTITFKLSRPGRQEWQFTTPQIPYYVEDGETSIDHIHRDMGFDDNLIADGGQLLRNTIKRYIDGVRYDMASMLGLANYIEEFDSGNFYQQDSNILAFHGDLAYTFKNGSRTNTRPVDLTNFKQYVDTKVADVQTGLDNLYSGLWELLRLMYNANITPSRWSMSDSHGNPIMPADIERYSDWQTNETSAQRRREILREFTGTIPTNVGTGGSG